ncbi:unnamed protein product [Didymodactylos carnosus]|uniref:Uncharacterized protein n=1 Tax=Didymodactylos carnosus TaxID=1234261 RepID=A0A815XW80_9BILA|nr:unnamed protein product [Didymodactylos carnosus]CAF4424199.1 unnamed protein product [Didymodactylos carnosus]
MTPVTSSRNETIIIDEDSEELDHSDIDILTNRFNGFNDKAHVKLNTFNTPDGGGGDGDGGSDLCRLPGGSASVPL